MRKLNVFVFVAILLSASNIGANNLYRFLEGKERLNHRGNYCEYHAQRGSPSHEVQIRSASPLQAYLDKRVHVTSIPGALDSYFTEQEELLMSRIKQLQMSVDILLTQNERMGRSPSSKIKSWSAKSNPAQEVDQLKREINRLRLQLAHLHDRSMTEEDLIQAFEEVSLRSGEALNEFPQLGMEIRYIPSMWPLTGSIELRPVWVTTGEKWKAIPASKEPVLHLSGSMVTPNLVKAFDSQSLPHSLDTYKSKLAPHEGELLGQTGWKFISHRQLILLNPQKNTEAKQNLLARDSAATKSMDFFPALPSSHIMVRASLDLDCLAKY